EGAAARAGDQRSSQDCRRGSGGTGRGRLTGSRPAGQVALASLDQDRAGRRRGGWWGQPLQPARPATGARAQGGRAGGSAVDGQREWWPRRRAGGGLSDRKSVV